MKRNHCAGRNRVIVVSAASKKGGKSTVAAHLVRELGAEYGLKVSAGGTHAVRPLTSDPEIISTPGTDTGALVAAGAGMVLWVNAPSHELGSELQRAMSMFPAPGLLVVEGGSALAHISPDFSVFLMGVPFEGFKPSAGPALEKSDLVLVNTSGPLAGADRSVLEAELRMRAQNATVLFYDKKGFPGALTETVRLARTALA